VDRATHKAHLAQAERHVAESKQHIARQRKILSDLERDGHVNAARHLLAQFEETLAMHIAGRDRLRKQLAT
jgi:hypothetical protein